MSEILNPGTKIKTEYGGTVEIVKYLAEGGQGYVYVVDYNGKQMALKWYKPNGLGKEPEKFYDTISKNIKEGAPSKEFLWPVAITEWRNGTFGYVMELRPEGCHELTEFMMGHARFSSYRAVVNAALQIVSAFRILHNKGYCYQDLNDGNFFIDPEKGNVLICDNDNVAPNKAQTGILGKPRYMAPEIVKGEAMPDEKTDRFSMAIILFVIFHMTHPLEGKRWYSPALPPALQERLYGSEALFIFDAEDKGNAPHPEGNRYAIEVWKVLPDYMRDIFTKSFCQKAITKPSARPSEKDWLNVLTRFRSEIIPCVCGNDIFTDGGLPCKCDSCGKMASVPFRLELMDYSIPATPDTRVFRCQLGVCNEEDALSPIAMVVKKVENGETRFGIRNKSGKRWEAVTTKGEQRKVAPDEVIPMKDGISFSVFDHTITIKKN